MKPFSLEFLHRLSSYHKPIIDRPEIAKVGCFYCLETYPKEEIQKWIDGSGCTALCPRCGIDAVLPKLRISVLEGGVLDTTDSITLRAMKESWFSLPKEPHPKPDQASHEEPAQSPAPDSES